MASLYSAASHLSSLKILCKGPRAYVIAVEVLTELSKMLNIQFCLVPFTRAPSLSLLTELR